MQRDQDLPRVSAATDVPVAHYFGSQPEVTSDPRDVELVLPEGVLRYRTDRGVFSHGRPDPGTRVLLTQAPAPPSSGDLLDLGCGAGPIALALARRAPEATVWAVDVNERAVDLCASNATLLRLTNVRACLPEDVPPDVRFAAIWSNPPIRIGKPALHALLLEWLARLAPDGSATLVVSRNLGSDSLATWLGGEGFEVERLASSKGYRILHVTVTPD